jgi:hypothetical protein
MIDDRGAFSLSGRLQNASSGSPHRSYEDGTGKYYADGGAIFRFTLRGVDQGNPMMASDPVVQVVVVDMLYSNAWERPVRSSCLRLHKNSPIEGRRLH